MSVKQLERTFAGGEISEQLFGRSDLAKYPTCVAQCRNFIPLPQGPVTRRPGTQFVREVKNSSNATRLIPFTYSTTQTMAIELGAGYFRFHTLGGTLLAANVILNGDFATNITSWSDVSIAPGSIAWDSGNGGRLALNYPGSGMAIAQQAFTTVAGQVYNVTITSANWIGVGVGTTGTGLGGTDLYGTAINGTATFSFTATGSTTYVTLNGLGATAYVTDITIGNGSPYEVANSYATVDLADIHYVQSADVLTLVHPNYPPQELHRLGATNWTLSTVAFTPVVTPPASGNINRTIGNSPGTYLWPASYVVTAVAADGFSESVSSGPLLGMVPAISGITNANPGVLTFSGSHFLNPGQTVTITGVGGTIQLNGNTYLVNTTPSASTLTIKTLAGVPVDTTTFGVYTSGGVLNCHFMNGNLLATGEYNSLTWAAVSGASRYNVYKYSGGVYGYIGSTTTELTLTDNNITPDIGKTPPIYDTVFSAAGDYPGAVSYYEQRRVLAGTINKPQNLWMTRSGTESAMAYSLPIKDDDRIAFRVAAREANTIRHVVPLGSLVLLTSGAEWRVTSINSDALTPASISVKPQSYVGASNVTPVVVGTSLLYAAARGGHLREMTYSWQQNGYATSDLSLLAAHLFDGYSIVDMTWIKSPTPVLWAVSSSGDLLSLTYVAEQQVAAWAHHDTGSDYFESITAVAEGAEDVVYAIVRRTIGGIQKRYVERMSSRLWALQQDAIYLDASLTYSGAPTTSLTGLAHLEGRTVSVWGDGAYIADAVVTSGGITLSQAVSTAQVGLDYTSSIITLPVSIEQAPGSAQGVPKNVNKVWARVVDSGVFGAAPVGSTTTQVRTLPYQYGYSPGIASGMVRIDQTPRWTPDGQVCVTANHGNPLTVSALVLELEIGG